jgi:hypothetical protein
MQLDGEFEWWGARASLVVTDGKGNDIGLPDSVRYYLVPGTQHGGGGGVTTGLVSLPAPGSQCLLPTSPVAEAPVWRALVPALIGWVAGDTAPPPSQYPTVAAGTAVTPEATGFPDLGHAMVPSGGKPVPLRLASSGIDLANASLKAMKAAIIVDRVHGRFRRRRRPACRPHRAPAPVG